MLGRALGQKRDQIGAKWRLNPIAEEVAANHREAAAGGAISGEAASSGSLGSLPREAVDAALQGDEAALLAWLDSGGRVNATCRAAPR